MTIDYPSILSFGRTENHLQTSMAEHYPVEIVRENLKVRIIDAETGHPYSIKDNQIVLCKPGRQFKVSFKSEGESMNVQVYLQGSEIPAGSFRVSSHSWSTFEHGGDKATWITLDPKTMDAASVGITQGKVDNGLIRFNVERPYKKEVEAHPIFGQGGRLYKTNGSKVVLESKVDEEPSTFQGGLIEKSMSIGHTPRFAEVGIAHGHDSTESYSHSKSLKIDQKRDMVFTVRMVADVEADKPKFRAIRGTLPPTADMLND